MKYHLYFLRDQLGRSWGIQPKGPGIFLCKQNSCKSNTFLRGFEKVSLVTIFEKLWPLPIALRSLGSFTETQTCSLSKCPLISRNDEYKTEHGISEVRWSRPWRKASQGVMRKCVEGTPNLEPVFPGWDKCHPAPGWVATQQFTFRVLWLHFSYPPPTSQSPYIGQVLIYRAFSEAPSAPFHWTTALQRTSWFQVLSVEPYLP